MPLVRDTDNDISGGLCHQCPRCSHWTLKESKVQKQVNGSEVKVLGYNCSNCKAQFLGDAED